MVNNPDFIPVLLGSDVNVYGMARSFHEAFGISSVAIGKGRLGATSNSRIVTVEVVEPRIEEDDIFCDTLISFAGRYPREQKLLLVPCGDNYIKLLVRNKEKLRDYYEFECIDEDLLMRLSMKESFYEICKQHGFDYPKTATCTADNYKDFNLSFDFPVIIKPSNSVAYWNCSFPHKKKVFVAYNREEFDAILNAIYGSSYQDHLVIQEYIPGDDSNMRVMNCFCGKDKKVKLISLGQALLEEHSPGGIGSYAAIIPTVDKELCERVKVFLESIGYIGFANFDIKYDIRDGKYNFFEINPRQGRSSFFVSAAGHNLAQYLADDIIYKKQMDCVISEDKVLWTVIPNRIIFKYVQDTELKKQAKELIKEGKVCRSLYYKPDMNLHRWIYFCKNQLSYFKKYKRYFGNKSLKD